MKSFQSTVLALVRGNQHAAEQSMRTKQSGVTLMELLVVIAVLGILASVALPTYRRYLLRTQRTDATTALLRLQAAQEKRYLQFGNYVTTTANLPNLPAAGGLGLLTTSERGYYNLSVAATATGYTATATPVAGGGQAADTQCATFTVTETGTKRAVNSGGADQTAFCFK
jgi:type IV pilus assembly protein PilE